MPNRRAVSRRLRPSTNAEPSDKAPRFSCSRPTSSNRDIGLPLATFYAARSGTAPPLLWPTFSPAHTAPLAVAIRRGAGAGPAIDEGPGIRGIPQDPGDPIERRRPPHRLTEPIALRHAEVPAGEDSQQPSRPPPPPGSCGGQGGPPPPPP